MAFAPFMIGRSDAARRQSVFVVPSGVTRIRVRSYRDAKKVIDTEIDVTPGQTFTIDTV